MGLKIGDKYTGIFLVILGEMLFYTEYGATIQLLVLLFRLYSFVLTLDYLSMCMGFKLIFLILFLLV